MNINVWILLHPGAPNRSNIWRIRLQTGELPDCMLLHTGEGDDVYLEITRVTRSREQIRHIYKGVSLESSKSIPAFHFQSYTSQINLI